MIEIKSYPARNGDAFIIKSQSDRSAMLIDGGFAETFNRHIRFDLDNLARDGYALDLVVATHVDADHISGLLTFFQENGSAQTPNIIPVRAVLHNSLRSLTGLGGTQASLQAQDLALLKELRRRGFSASGDEQEISARQGSSLSQSLLDGGYSWNTHTGLLSVGGIGLVELPLPNAKVKILGPSTARLDALKNWWISEIRRVGVVGPLEGLDDVFELLCAYEPDDPGAQLLSASDDLATEYAPDKSVTNGSSISFVLEVDDQKFLFLGDSWAEDIVTALTADGFTVFDAIKISHHGSAHNTSPALLELIDSPHFFISTNGARHNHPDFSVLKAIADRPAKFLRTLHFNYSTPASQKLKKLQGENARFRVEDGQSDWVKITRAKPT